MKLNLCLSGMLSIAVAVSVAAQDNVQNGKLDFIDLTAGSQNFDGSIYVANDRYYVANSIESFFLELKIDPKKDIEKADLISASNPYSAETLEPLKEQLPEKYRSFKALIIFHLRKQ